MTLTKLTKLKAPKADSTYLRINEYLKTKHNPVLNYEPKPSHSPSSFGSKCFRKIYYTFWKVPKDNKIDAKTARIFETGNYYEDMVMDWLKAMGEHIPYRDLQGNIPIGPDGKPNAQFPISIEDWRIRKGFIDNLAVLEDGLWLYEIKSCASFKFQELEEPMDDHKVQIAPYYKAVTTALNDGSYAHLPELDGITEVAGVKVIYINKDNSDIKIFPIRAEQLKGFVEMVDTKVNDVDPYLVNRELPPPTPDKCSYCAFSKKCKENWNLA